MKTTPETTIIEFDYNTHAIAFTGEAWVNLTVMCAAFDKRPIDFLRIDPTRAFLDALSADTGLPIRETESEFRSEPGSLLKSDNGIGRALIVTLSFRGGGSTWVHPDIGIECARWLSPQFAIWTNRKIRQIMAGQIVHPAMDHETLLKQEGASRAAYRRLQDERMRRMELLDVPGNVSALAYALAAGLPATRGVGTVAGSLAKRYATVRGLPMGMTRQSITSRAKRSLVATYPPECLRDAYLHYGYGHEMPALAVIENRWRPLLPQHHRLNRVLALGG